MPQILIDEAGRWHDAGGLLLRAAADRVDVVFVVVDNDGGGIFSFLPQAEYPLHFETVFGTPHGRDLTVLAKLHDLPIAVVREPEELGGTVRDAVAAGGVRIVLVRTDRGANVAVHRRLRAAVAEVLTQA